MSIILTPWPSIDLWLWSAAPGPACSSNGNDLPGLVHRTRVVRVLWALALLRLEAKVDETKQEFPLLATVVPSESLHARARLARIALKTIKEPPGIPGLFQALYAVARDMLPATEFEDGESAVASYEHEKNILVSTAESDERMRNSNASQAWHTVVDFLLLNGHAREASTVMATRPAQCESLLLDERGMQYVAELYILETAAEPTFTPPEWVQILQRRGVPLPLPLQLVGTITSAGPLQRPENFVSLRDGFSPAVFSLASQCVYMAFYAIITRQRMDSCHPAIRALPFVRDFERCDMEAVERWWVSHKWRLLLDPVLWRQVESIGRALHSAMQCRMDQLMLHSASESCDSSQSDAMSQLLVHVEGLLMRRTTASEEAVQLVQSNGRRREMRAASGAAD